MSGLTFEPPSVVQVANSANQIIDPLTEGTFLSGTTHAVVVGTVQVGGTVNAAVVGTPTVQVAGTATVTVAGTVAASIVGTPVVSANSNQNIRVPQHIVATLTAAATVPTAFATVTTIAKEFWVYNGTTGTMAVGNATVQIILIPPTQGYFFPPISAYDSYNISGFYYTTGGTGSVVVLYL